MEWLFYFQIVNRYTVGQSRLFVIQLERKIYQSIFTASGAVGGVCALSNVLGQETCELYSLAKQGKFDEAKTLQQRLIGPNAAVRMRNNHNYG